jgi:hypothetical protein
MKNLVVVVFCMLIFGCNNSYRAQDNLNEKEYSIELTKIAPYVAKKPDDISLEQRFDPRLAPYYQKYIQATRAQLNYFKETDTAKVFSFTYRDRSSLYEHYQAFGGYYRTDEQGKIVFMNLLYHTPRLTKEEMAGREHLLFEEMITHGNVNAFIGDKKFINTPNKDFYYNTKLNRWDYTPNSSWKFLQDEQQRND